MENGDKIIRTRDILDVYERVLSRKMTLSDADLWAGRILRLHDEKMIHLEVEFPSRDWDAIKFLLGIDIQTAPGEYLYGIEDVKDALLRFFPS